jgi:pimeloyl-ACP methyl ester carboxylesterase
MSLPFGATERFVVTNGIRLHLVDAGPSDGPPVVLLHGFPEFWYGWRRQIPALAASGHRVLVLDQRGYNQSDKPHGVASYRPECLVADVLGLLDGTGLERAFVVGHDWGALVAWWLALAAPERVDRLGILNAPHPAVMRWHLLVNPRQTLRSWYIFFFQLPGLAERWMARDGFRNAVRMLRTARRGSFSEEDLARYREAWSQAGALTAMVNWYRAALHSVGRRLPGRRVRVPTLMLWGARDIALGREMARPSIDLCENGRLVFFEKATHFVQHDEAEAVNEHLVRFLGSH